MSDINTFSPAVCAVTDVTTMDIPRPLDTEGCGSLQANAIDSIAELQVCKTASAIADAPNLDANDIAEFREHRLNARLAGREFFAHDGQVFSIHSRYSDVVNNYPAATPGPEDITLNTIDFTTLEIPNTDNRTPVMPDDGVTLPTEAKPGDDSASSEILTDVSDFQARRLAARLNGQNFFMHNGEQLAIHDHYIDYRVSVGDVDAKPEFPGFIEPVVNDNRVDESNDDLSPLPSDVSTYEVNV